jgi:actin-related protein 6
MNNERFTVPEIIFRPDDIGMVNQIILLSSFHSGFDPGLDRCGLPLTVAASISLLPEDIRDMFWANIGLIGGNTKFPGFSERL